MTPTTADDTTKLHLVSKQLPRYQFYYADSNTQHYKGLSAETFTIIAPGRRKKPSSRGPQHMGQGANSSTSDARQRRDRPAAPPLPVPEAQAREGAGRRRAGGTCPPLRGGEGRGLHRATCEGRRVQPRKGLGRPYGTRAMLPERTGAPVILTPDRSPSPPRFFPRPRAGWPLNGRPPPPNGTPALTRACASASRGGGAAHAPGGRGGPGRAGLGERGWGGCRRRCSRPCPCPALPCPALPAGTAVPARPAGDSRLQRAPSHDSGGGRRGGVCGLVRTAAVPARGLVSLGFVQPQ